MTPVKPVPRYLTTITSKDSGIYEDSDMFKQSFYGRTATTCAGYKKFTVAGITYLPKDPSEPSSVMVALKSHHAGHLIFEEMNYNPETGRLEEIRGKVFFTNIYDYFIFMENSQALYKRCVKENIQYNRELADIKNKYPEHFYRREYEFL